MSTAGESGNVRIAGAAAFVSMADKRVRARIAGAVAFVSMADGGVRARIAGAAAAVRFLPVIRIVVTTVIKTGNSRLLTYDRLCFQSKACDIDLR